MLPSLSRPPLECCLGTNPIQAEKLRPDRKLFGSPTLATSAVASNGPTPGMQLRRFRLIGTVPSQDHSIKFQDLLFEAEQLAAQRGKACTHNLRHPFVVRISNDT